MSRSKRAALVTDKVEGRLRCAIYTRKSTEEGLEQAFNSLHAQREAYVLSQAGEGWVALPAVYDDGGFSGGNTERPALKRLLEDVDGGRIDVVVVYKVDRLTRALADFAKIVERFDARSVSFVSVTQAFNTTSSMGRLTLNVLLSFAQFEREVTGERIRDKIAASKARGMWMGGCLPLGYDAQGRTLVVNPAEAETVRAIFRRYLELGSVNRLRAELQAQGVRSKVRTTRDGKTLGGVAIGRGALFHILQNRLYLGQIVHKTAVHPGLHPAIVDTALFEAVQAPLQQNRVGRRERGARVSEALLTGRLFTADGEAMSPSFAYCRRGRPYRYYIAASLQRGGTPAGEADVIRRVGAAALETAIVEHLRRLTGRPALGPAEACAMLRRVELRRSDTQLVLELEALADRDHPEFAFEALRARLAPEEKAVQDGEGAVRVVLAQRMQLRGGRTWLVGTKPEPKTREPNPGLVEALKSSHAELLERCASPLTPASQLLQASSPDTHHRRQLARLPFLAPDLQKLILQGAEPDHLKLRILLKSELPLAWADQRAMLLGQ